jgi:Synergist-CTERM protein sorting domain-containing protein
MLLAGIEVKRLASDVEIDVEGWHYNARTIGSGGIGPFVNLADSGSTGWLNRNATVYPISGRKFKKDETYVVYLGQLRVHLIPMYMEPDFPWNAASCIFLPYMSVALGGASTGALSPSLVEVEMPAYRYLKEVDLPTYDLDHFLPLINRGGVPRFFSYHTKDSVKAIADGLGIKPPQTIKVFDYDIQLHTRTDALVNGRFDMSLPTSENTSSYMIQKKDGTYAPLATHSSMIGSNIATIVVADHGRAPWTVDLDNAGRPAVGDGSYRTVPKALPAFDDLIGVRIVEIIGEEDDGGGDEDNCRDKIEEWLNGCSTGFAMLALFALLPFFVRRK